MNRRLWVRKNAITISILKLMQITKVIWPMSILRISLIVILTVGNEYSFSYNI